MRLIGFISAASLLIAVCGCSVDDNGSPRLSLAGDDSPSSGYGIAIGSAAHDDAYMDPYDPADQQRNQGHGLGVGPDDPAYFSQFLRF
ncbi:MAG TPA: hypothetical protein VMQ11_18445 [Alphaproteobacteria bacterium]|nr:hypothetical protein [Alphaproteobacteria bacterium]